MDVDRSKSKVDLSHSASKISHSPDNKKTLVMKISTSNLSSRKQIKLNTRDSTFKLPQDYNLNLNNKTVKINDNQKSQNTII